MKLSDLPKDARVIVTIDGVDVEFEKLAETGDGHALLRAVKSCGELGVDPMRLGEWVRKADGHIRCKTSHDERR